MDCDVQVCTSFGQRLIEAVSHARELKEKHHVFLSKTKDAVGQFIGGPKNPLLNANPSITVYETSSRCLIALNNT